VFAPSLTMRRRWHIRPRRRISLAVSMERPFVVMRRRGRAWSSCPVMPYFQRPVAARSNPPRRASPAVTGTGTSPLDFPLFFRIVVSPNRPC
jgi:hypothetical protein